MQYRFTQTILHSQNIVSDCKKYDRCRLISTLLSLDEKHEYIKIFCDDEKGRILSVQKPMQLPLCPEPTPSISPWLMKDWMDYRVEIKIQNVNEQHFTTFTLPRKLTKLVYTRPALSPLDFLRIGL